MERQEEDVVKPYEATQESDDVAAKGEIQFRRECRRMREEVKKEKEK